MENIKLNSLSKIYHKTLFALNDITLQLSVHKITTIMGKSSSGKSTLLRIINGLEKPDIGVISLPKNLKQTTVFQEARLLPWLTIKENILFWEQGDIDQLLEELELKEFRDFYPHEISRRYEAKNIISRALICNSQLILMDEPFSSLDYFTKKHLQQKILVISKRRNLGIIFITHDVDEAIILDHGIIRNQIINPLPRSGSRI